MDREEMAATEKYAPPLVTSSGLGLSLPIELVVLKRAFGSPRVPLCPRRDHIEKIRADFHFASHMLFETPAFKSQE
jgi:hypothetical protein